MAGLGLSFLGSGWFLYNTLENKSENEGGRKRVRKRKGGKLGKCRRRERNEGSRREGKKREIRNI